MNLRDRLRQRRHQAQIGLNRARGRAYLPRPRQFLYIETSSQCNLACAFCAYAKKSSPKTIMSNDFFFDVIEQATAMGYDRFGLTPITGDLFMDKHIMEKMAFLERHPKVECFHFYTNFIIPDPDTVAGLADLSKLSELGISLYGHDRDSFMALTKGNAAGYDRLLANLQAVYDVAARLRNVAEIHWRLQDRVRAFDHADSALVGIVQRLTRDKSIRLSFVRQYNNWGGMISAADVSGLGIEITGEEDVHKNGACVLVFHKQQVMADGRVNACACRDANATLCIGDLNTDPLRHILSSANETYMKLIEHQEAGQFNQVCRSCDFYRSIYKKRKLHGAQVRTLDAFRQEIEPAPGSIGSRMLGG